MQVLEGGLLHTRFLRLGNDAGQLQAIDEGAADIEAFTVAAGEHPIFTGVQRITIVGFNKPEWTSMGGTVQVRGEGLELELKGATLSPDGRDLIVHMKPPSPAP
ncbi:MAG: hypothetical protein HC834_10010 [Rhodospirillales bacterium]|nr:hypothetical protein [Rhodospirillales bacterium]